jgi:hypothetical protein
MRRPVAVLALSLAALAITCKSDGGTATPVPTTVTISPGAVTLSALGATQPLTATVRDQNNNVMTGQGITWTSTNTAAVTVSPAGVVTAVANGTASVRAEVGAVQGSITVTVAQTVSALVKVSGDAQSATVGSALPTALVVRTNDANGNPVAGVTVTLAVTQGGGNLTATSQVTATNGQIAGVTWTIGNVAGAAQQATASATGAPAATFTATANAGPAASVALQAGDNQTGPQGLALPTDPAVIVRDALNNPVPNAIVTFAVTTGNGSVTGAVDTTGANGVAAVGSWVMGDPGANSLTATVTGAGITGNPITFNATSTAAGAPASVSAFDGNNQTGLVGFALNVRPAVIVRDALSAPVSNVQVDFAVTGGGGSVTGATVLTGVDGVARVGSWVLGGSAGANTMTATVSGITPATITATGATKQYNIDVRFLTAVSAGARAAFDSAEARWERILYGELTSIAITNPVDTCAQVPVPAINETVDDLLIFVRLDSIDGPLNQLGAAGPCFFRSADSIPIVGAMRFDTADVATFVGQGLFDEIVMHEMGHVIGVGGLWLLKGQVVNPSLPSSPGVDTHYPRPSSVAAFNSAGGSGYVAGQKVPVDNGAQLGTADAHWREGILDTELMTGFLDGGVANPLSVISIASLLDIGYTRANYAAADPYVVANPLLRAGPAQKIPYGADVSGGILRFLDANGRVVRTVRAPR